MTAAYRDGLLKPSGFNANCKPWRRRASNSAIPQHHNHHVQERPPRHREHGENIRHSYILDFLLASMADTITICVYPLTPTYSTLPRFNTKALLFFILLSPSSSWATKGALAALLARTATLAIHAMVLLGTKNADHALELDIISSWFTLAEVAAAVPLMLCWTGALKGSKARAIVKIWGTLVAVGAICAFATVRWALENVGERSCRVDGDEKAVEMSGEWVLGRLAQDTLLGKFDIMALAATAFGLWICVRPSPWSLWREMGSSIPKLIYVLEVLASIVAAIALIGTVVFHERYLFAEPTLPMLLPVTSYEQWECWVATGLVVMATVFNWTRGSSSSKAPKVMPYNEGVDPLYPQKDLGWGGILGKPLPSVIR